MHEEMRTGPDHSGTLNAPAPNPECTLELEGRAGWERIALAIPVTALGVWFCKVFADTPNKNEDAAGWLVAAGVCFLIAVCLPIARSKFLDLHRREWVHLKYYAGLQFSKRTRSFDEFDAIVLRHVEHDNEEDNSKYYTGDVGLRPRDGGGILTLKVFDATPYWVPAAAVEFAREMSKLTGLPETE